MSLANNPRARQRFMRAIAHIQLELADLMTEIDATMAGQPMPGVAKLLAQADVFIERASDALDEAAKNIGAIS